MRVKVEVHARERRGGTKSVWNQVAADGCGLCCPRNEPCAAVLCMHWARKEGRRYHRISQSTGIIEV